jgi:hypothetical protein
MNDYAELARRDFVEDHPCCVSKYFGALLAAPHVRRGGTMYLRYSATPSQLGLEAAVRKGGSCEAGAGDF